MTLVTPETCKPCYHVGVGIICCLEYSEASLTFLLFKKKKVFPYLKAQEIFLVLEIQYNLSFLFKKKRSLLILTFPGIRCVYFQIFFS